MAKSVVQVSVAKLGGCVGVKFHEPPKPELQLMLSDHQVLEMVSYLQETCMPVIDQWGWESPVEVEFVDASTGHSDKFNSTANNWFVVCQMMLRAVDPQVILAHAPPAGRA